MTARPIRKSAPAQSTSSRAIDIHAHFYPERFLKALAEGGGAPGFTVEYSGTGRSGHGRR